MEWTRILAYITGTVDQELLLRNEYLAAENRILKAQLKGCLRLSDAERAKLGEIGHRLGRKSLGEVATTALPDTILAWYRRLVARKFDGLFTGVILDKALNEHDVLEMWIERAYLFVGISSFFFTFALPAALLEMQRARYDAETDRRRRAVGIQPDDMKAGS